MIHTVAVLRRAPLVPRLAAVVVALLLAGACSDDGRDLAPPGPGQTTTTEPPPAVTGPAATTFTLSSEAFEGGGALPERFTCDGLGVSPPLSWENIPPAIELALVARDRDAGGYVHWIVTGIDPAVTGFGEAGVPEGAVEQVNGEGSIGWLPACPPEGDERHVYEVVLHGLGSPLEIDPELPASEVAALVEGASVGSARLTATATR